MLYRKLIVSTRTLLQLTVAVIFLVSGVGSAFAATNNGNPPLLVPYLIQALAGNTQPSSSGGSPPSGYGGDGLLAISPIVSGTYPNGVNSTLNGAQMVIADSVGNVYIADTGNAIIREINATTGIISTVAGNPPSSCTPGTVTCAKTNNGCTDGTPAKGYPIGGNIRGLAVDGYGNIYFADITTESISIVYRGGTQVANFINLVNPAGVAKSNGVQVGYVYHVAGSVNLQSCVPASTRNNDNLPAFADTSQTTYIAAVTTATPPTLSNAASLNMNSPEAFVNVDSAGNIYVIDVSNNVIRVINTQSTPQVFFQTLVEPGYMTAIIDCSVYTTACPATITTTVGTGINGPADAVSYVGDLAGSSADAYGNVYEINYKGANPGIYAGAAYAGGSALAKLQSAEWGISVSYGNFYEVINNVGVNTTLPNVYEGVLSACCGAASGGGGIAIRPDSINADAYGTLWYWDEHYPSIFRIDQYSSVATTISGWGGTSEQNGPSGCFMRCEYAISGTKYATWATPTYCVYGTTASPVTAAGLAASPQGTAANPAYDPQTYDRFGDNCPALIAAISEVEAGTVIADGPGNLFFADQGNGLIRELPLDNFFPATAVGTTVTQPIQVHFDSTNNPSTGGSALPNLFTTSFSIPGPDFSINTTTPEFQMGSLGFYGYDYTLGPANTGTPTSTTVGVTAGSILFYAGIPSCTELGQAGANNTSMDCLVYVNFTPTQPGPRNSQLVTTTANGSIYNFPLVGYGTGTQLRIDGGLQAVVSTTGLGNASAVAVTNTGTVYIADPSNNRVVVEPAGGGSQAAIGPAIASGNLTVPVPAPAGYANTSALNSLTLSGPKGVAVDAANNVYISDTGHNRILKYNPVTQQFAVIGQTLWTACTSPTPASLPAVVPGVPAKTPPTCTASGNTVGVYQWNAPQGLAVDAFGNVYVADTGNGVVVEIPSNPVLGGAIPLLQYPGAPAFTSPVAVAIGPYYNYQANTFTQNSVFVADTANPNGYVVMIPPGGGDLTTGQGGELPSNTLLGLGQQGFGTGLNTPSGVAVDGAGNVYISDSTGNQVVEYPSNTPNGAQFQVNFNSLSSPGGLALDSNGNLYVADTGNSRVLLESRQNPAVSFGMVPQSLGVASGVEGQPIIGGQPCPVAGVSTPCTGILTVTNTGTSTITLAQPIATVSGVANPAYNISTTTCGATLQAGATCTISPTFTPAANTGYGETVLINGGPQSIALTSQGISPAATISILPTTGGFTPPAGSTPTITATVTQSHPNTVIPTGTVNFYYAIDTTGTYATYAGQCGASGQFLNVPLNGAGVAVSPALPALGNGRQYVINATYNPDVAGANFSSSAQAPTITLTTPSIAPITAVSPSYTGVYGAAAPNLNAVGGGESVTGILAADQATVSYHFVSAATSNLNGNAITAYVTAPTNSANPPYPINVVFSGGNFCNYGVPTVTTTAGGSTPSTVTVNPTPLTVGFTGPFSSAYGAPDLNFSLGITYTGAVNGDQKRFLASFVASAGAVSSSHSSALPYGTYLVTPTLSAGNPILVKNYTITTNPGTLGIGQSPSTISVVFFNNSATSSSTNYAVQTPGAKVTGSLFTNYVTSAVPGGVGTPTGTISVYDSVVPFTFPATGTSGPALGLGAVQPPCTLPFVGVTTSGSPTVTGIGSTFDIVPGEGVSGVGITAGTTISAVLLNGVITLSAPAMVSSPAAYLTSTVAAGTTCTALIGTLNLAPASTGGSTVTYTPNVAAAPFANSALGNNQLIFAYSGDTNFYPYVTPVATSTSATCTPQNVTSGTSGSVLPTNCLIVDNADFYISTPYSFQGLTQIVPGYVPNPNNTSSSQTWPVNINSVSSETGTVTLTCLPIGNPNATFTAATTSGSPTLTVLGSVSGLLVGATVTGPGFLSGATVLSLGSGTVTLSANAAATATNVVFTYVVPPPTGATAPTAGGTPVLTAQSYIQCLVTPATIAMSSNGNVTAVLSVSTPASEPLGFNFYSMVPTEGSSTILAFLPLGIFAFCMRRRRRLSKALWMVLVIALVSVGMSGCGGNTVSFYSPIPLGPQYVTVTASGTSLTGATPLVRSFSVEINIQ